MKPKWYKTHLLVLFLVFPFVTYAASAQELTVSLNLTNATLEQALNEIGKQTSLSIVYNNNDVNAGNAISIHVQNEKLSKVMNKLLAKSNASYTIRNNHLVLYAAQSNANRMQPAQQKRFIKGNVKDETGEPLIGVSVLLQGTTVGTTTDFDGNFSIEVGNNDAVLEFSYIGYRKITQAVKNQSVLNIVMQEDTKVLGEVVVTALGIEKKAESLTYATQKVGGDELTRAKDANFINALQGKTAGLVITPNSTGAGGSSKLLLRGNSSILGNNQPLIVLDGVPMNDNNTTQITDALLSGGNTTDGGDGLSNINPDDIENITVLKGANAAALYGSKAANGVIMITTKQGSEGRATISVSSSIMFETPLVTPKLQNKYGANIENYSDTSLNPNSPVNKRRLGLYSWGSPIGQLSDVTLGEVPYARNYAVDNINSFLQTGTNYNNSVSASFGSEKATTYMSYGNTTAKGIIPENKFSRHNLTFRENIKLFNQRLELSLSGSYILQESDNRPGSGIYANPLYDLYIMPRNADISYFENNSEVYGQLYYINPIQQDGKTVYPKANAEGPIQQWPWSNEENRNSPYWYVNRLKRNNIRERFFGTVGAKVNIIDGLTAQARFKIDRVKDTNETKTYQGTRAKNFYNSIYEYSKSESNQIFADFLVSYNKTIEDFEIGANVGGSTMKLDNSAMGFNYWMADSTSTPNVFDPSNVITTKKDGAHVPTTKSQDQNWENAIYGTLSIGYKDLAYIDGSFRTDWSRVYTQFAALGTPDHYTYYSVGGNVMLNNVFNIENENFNHAKLRVSFSEVGNSIPNQNYAGMSQNWGSQIIEASAYRTFYNPLPETMKSTEVGIDMRLFRNAIDFDFTFYNTLMVNQWLPKTAATGGSLPLNSGKIRNRGIETTIGYNLASADHKFTWRTSLNYSYNVNKILETYGENLDSPMETEPVYGGGLRLRYEVGKPYGELYGKTFLYDENGNIKTDINGAPMSTSDYNCYLGNANSPHHLGWSNNFTYKDFNFYFLIDGKIGGTVISYTEALLDAYGVSERSGDARDSGVTYLKKTSVGGVMVMQPVPGVIMPDGNIAPAQEYYQAIGMGEPTLSEYAWSATNFRLREVSLGYTFRNLFGNGKNLNVSAVARNLFFLYKESPVDPDVSVSTANSYGGIEAFSMPTTRSFGLNLKATF